MVVARASLISRRACSGSSVERRVGHAEVHRQRDQPGLGAVVQVALEPAQLGGGVVDRLGPGLGQHLRPAARASRCGRRQRNAPVDRRRAPASAAASTNHQMKPVTTASSSTITVSSDEGEADVTATSSQARSRQVIGSGAHRAQLGERSRPAAVGRYGGGIGVPRTRPAIAPVQVGDPAQSPGRHAAGSARPTHDDDQHAADDAQDEQHQQRDRPAAAARAAYPVSRSGRRRGGQAVLTGPSSRIRPDVAQWC